MSSHYAHAAQPAIKDYIAQSDVVIYSLWEPSRTQAQLRAAFAGALRRAAWEEKLSSQAISAKGVPTRAAQFVVSHAYAFCNLATALEAAESYRDDGGTLPAVGDGPWTMDEALVHAIGAWSRNWPGASPPRAFDCPETLLDWLQVSSPRVV